MSRRSAFAPLVVPVVIALLAAPPARGQVDAPAPAPPPTAENAAASDTPPPAPSPPPEPPAAREARKAGKIAAANLTLTAQLAETEAQMKAVGEWQRQVQDVRRRRTTGGVWLIVTGIVAGLAAGSVPLWVDEKSMGPPLAAGLGLSVGLMITGLVVLPSGTQP